MPGMLDNLKITGDMGPERAAVLNHSIVHGFSFLAAQILEKEYLQIVCSGVSGFYIGCEEPDGVHVIRDSQEFWATKFGAEQALKARSWTQRLNP